VARGVNLQTGEIELCHALECPFAIRPENGRAECQPTGRFRFICADNPTHGYYQLTVRKRAIEGFLGQIDFAKSILGRITGYPWQLIMERETVQLESGQRKLWIPQLEIEPRIFQELLRQKHKGERLALPEGITEPTPEMEKELTEDLDYEADEEIEPKAEEFKKAVEEQVPQAKVRQVKLGRIKQKSHDAWRAKLDKLAADIIEKGERGMTQLDYEAILDWLYEETLTQKRCAEAKERLLAWEPPEPGENPEQGEIEF